MRKTLMAAAIATILCGAAWAEGEDAARLAEPWNAPYTGEDAAGGHVIALWAFDAGAELADSSGHGHDLKLNGAKVVADGRFGGCLESWRGWPDSDTAHQAWTKAAPALTPKSAFTVEMWIKPKPELKGYPDSFLLDNRYVDESGIQLILGDDSVAGRRLQMVLGFGEEHATWSSHQYIFEPGVWHHIAFTYDGKGSGRFYIDGAAQGGEDRPQYGAVASGVKNLNLGDRVGSLFHGFPGYIDQVRLCQGVLEFSLAAFEAASPRRVFSRMEKVAVVSFALVNKQRAVLRGAKAEFVLGGMPQPAQPVPDLAPGQRHVINLKLDTSLRPDVYRLAATIQVAGEHPYRSTQEFSITIVPRRRPHVMPVVMWGGSLNEVDWLTKLGFTHSIGVRADLRKIWEAGSPTEPASAEGLAKEIADLDKALAHGLGVVASLSPGRWAEEKKELRRIGADGKPVGEEACGLFPELPKFCYNVGASVARAYGGHPALQSALVHTEVRGASRPCYHDHDREALKAATGLADIPDGVKTQWGTRYEDIAGFPTDRVIPDDYPLYVYYKWFWKEGDGWNDLHTRCHRGSSRAATTDLWTFHDPAVRVPASRAAAATWTTSRTGPTPTPTPSASVSVPTSCSAWPAAASAAASRS